MKKILGKKHAAFSLAETTVCLLVLSVILAAVLPVITIKKNTVIDSAVSSYWTLSGINLFNGNSGAVGIFNSNPQYGVTVGSPVSADDQNVIMFGKYGTTAPTISNDEIAGVAWLPSKSIFKALVDNNNSWIISSAGNYSVAVATDTETLGDASVAIAADVSEMRGDYSIVSGAHKDIVYSPYSAIIATESSNASGDYSVIFSSSNANATGLYTSIFSGDNYSNATGDYSTIVNTERSTASGVSSSIIATANPATASGNYSAIISSSNYNNVLGPNSTVIGSSNSTAGLGGVVGQNVVFTGEKNIAQGLRSVVLGGYENQALGAYGIVGGYRMTIPSNMTGCFLFGSGPASLYDAGATLTYSAGLYVNNVYFSGAISYPWTSDKRLKNVLGTYNKGLKEIIALNPIFFKYKKISDLDYKKTQVGLTAQNVKSVIPEAIEKSPISGYLTYSIQPIQYAQINAIKELYQENKNIEKENKKLEAETINLKKELYKLDNKIAKLESKAGLPVKRIYNKEASFIQKLTNWLYSIISKTLLGVI